MPPWHGRARAKRQAEILPPQSKAALQPASLDLAGVLLEALCVLPVQEQDLISHRQA